MLTESSSEDICVLLQYDKAVESTWGSIPVNLKRVVPIGTVKNIEVNSRKSEFSIILKPFPESTDKNPEQMNKMCNERNELAFRAIELRAVNSKLQLAWITLLQKARSFVMELRRE